MKRGLGEEFALPYPNIRTKEGYVMKKRVLALALSLVVVVSVSACGSELKESSNIENPKENVKVEVPSNEEKTIEGLCEAISNTKSADKSITQFILQESDLGPVYIATIQDVNGSLPVGTLLVANDQIGTMYYEANENAEFAGTDVKEYFSSALDYLGLKEEQQEKLDLVYSYLGLGGNMRIIDVGGYRFVASATEKFNYYLMSQPAESLTDYVEGQILDLGKNDSNTTTPKESQTTIGQRNALRSATNYLNTMAFSKSGLIDQLEYEGYSTEEATYAVENCGADWNEQAAKSAQNYINTMSFSRSGLIDQLIYEGFTREQAEYGVSAVGY